MENIGNQRVWFVVYHQFYIVFECYKIKEIKGVIERMREAEIEKDK